MYAFLRSRLFSPAVVALVVFGANLAATQFAWQSDDQQMRARMREVSEVYLDGMIAGIRPGLERNMPGDVDRQLRAEFTEQKGIAERLLLVADSTGAVINIAGEKKLLTDELRTLESGAIIFDDAAKTMAVSRRMSNGGRAIALLNTSTILADYAHMKRSVWLMNGGLAFLAAMIAATLMGLATWGADARREAKTPTAA